MDDQNCVRCEKPMEYLSGSNSNGTFHSCKACGITTNNDECGGTSHKCSNCNGFLNDKNVCKKCEENIANGAEK
jgi:hypothetical protein